MFSFKTENFCNKVFFIFSKIKQIWHKFVIFNNYGEISMSIILGFIHIEGIEKLFAYVRVQSVPFGLGLPH